MSDLQQEVQKTIDELVESGAERGLQVAVYKDGDLVVDAVAGTDPATDRPLTSDTPVYVASTGKSLTSTLIHVLAEQGVLDYDTPIAQIWPEFAAHGKQDATIRHALAFTVGVPGVPEDSTADDLLDWDKITTAIADTQPWWEPGTKVGYHPQTFGYILGEIVRRATGDPISKVLHDKIATPLGLQREIYLGVPTEELSRVARLEQVGPQIDMEQLRAMMPTFFKIAPPAVQLSAELCNRDDYLTADIPAGGTMTARGVAKVYAALAGQLHGTTLISDQRLKEISQVAVADTDQIFGMPTQYALGYSIGRPVPDAPAEATIIGWPGAGGSVADADLTNNIAFAVTKTRFTPGDYTTIAPISALVTKHLT
ncbi:CubicO group peptidase (beta-lactamase class C family) [Sphaerisporangium siamense]|uniref:CubicO group peptidase (Beta-lactamase class C family) n=1 Tax=Sphaerisporangium siamense TaxID=795645 RepID=A0A7W7GBH0_9ACTN|nr:serine hydrolase domain-containing protein [Sphaerisporangium siamense]MBB4702429.1 CubicO group peptidase (beta-lactamase class C family) [Sphaerisporangium siamense]